MDSMSAADFRAFIGKKHKNGYKSSGELTRAILDYLNISGFKAWRNNTSGIFDIKIFAKKLRSLPKLTVSGILDAAKKSYRKSHELLGASDIVSVHLKSGKAFFVEVKFGKDKQSPEQIQFEYEIGKSGAFYVVARSLADVIYTLEKIDYEIRN